MVTLQVLCLSKIVTFICHVQKRFKKVWWVTIFGRLVLLCLLLRLFETQFFDFTKIVFAKKKNQVFTSNLFREKKLFQHFFVTVSRQTFSGTISRPMYNIKNPANVFIWIFILHFIPLTFPLSLLHTTEQIK